MKESFVSSKLWTYLYVIYTVFQKLSHYSCRINFIIYDAQMNAPWHENLAGARSNHPFQSALMTTTFVTWFLYV